MRPLPWGALQGAEAGRQAQYLLEVALPLEIRRVAGEEGGSREKGEGAGKRIALGGSGRGKEKGGKKEGGGKGGKRKGLTGVTPSPSWGPPLKHHLALASL